MVKVNLNEKTNTVVNYSDINYNYRKNEQEYNYNQSIFDKTKNKNTLTGKNLEILDEKLDKARDNDGCFSSLWNMIKVSTNKGISDRNCDEAIEAYKKGEITFEEAKQEIEEYKIKQEEGVNLLSNITASVASLAGVLVLAGVLMSPISVTLAGALIGGGTKALFKLIDRATNNKDGDALDMKQIAKDGLSGAVTGGIATVTMGTASSAVTIKEGIINCGITGLKTGGLSASVNYSIDCAFEKNKKFKAKDFALTTTEGVLVGGAVGGIMGGANASMHASGILNSGCSFKTFLEKLGQTSKKDVAANSVCTAEYKILNDRIKSTYQ